MHKTRVTATLTLLLARWRGVHCLEGPAQMPDPQDIPAPVAITDVPGATNTAEPPAPAPIIAAPQGEGKTEQKPVTPPPPAPVASQIAQPPSCGNGQQKPLLAVTHTGPPEQVWFSTSYLLWRLAARPLDSIIVTQDGVPIVGGPVYDTNFGEFRRHSRRYWRLVRLPARVRHSIWWLPARAKRRVDQSQLTRHTRFAGHRASGD